MLRTITATNAVRAFKPVQAATAARRAYSTGFDSKEKAEEAKYIRAKVQSHSDSNLPSMKKPKNNSHPGPSDPVFFTVLLFFLQVYSCSFLFEFY